MFTVSRHGDTLAQFAGYWEAVAYLHRVQGQSIDWACKYEGYAIKED